MSDEDDISRVREEEIDRGRRPKHPQEKEQARRLRALVLSAIHRGNRGFFQQLLIDDFGLEPGSAEYESLLKKFDDYQRDRR